MRVFKNPYVIASLCYLAIILYIFWPILWPAEGTLIFGDDIHRSYHFFRQLFGDAIARGEFPWWNPYLFSGEPFIANPSLAFWYPVNWLFALIPYRFVYSWIIPLHILWAMLGMYILLTKGEGKSKKEKGVDDPVLPFTFYRLPFSLSAWTAGLIFGLSGFFMGRIWEGHIELILSASWMPWVVWAFLQLARASISVSRRIPAREIVLAAVVLAIQILAGYQTMALFTLEAVFIITVIHAILAFASASTLTTGLARVARISFTTGLTRVTRIAFTTGLTRVTRIAFTTGLTRVTRIAFTTGLAGLTGLALSAIQILPSQEFFRASIRTYALPYSWAVFGSYTIGNLKQLIDPFIFGFPWSYKGPSPNFGEMAAYMSKLGLLLAIIPVVAAVLFMFKKLSKRIMNYESGIMDKQTMVFVLSMVGIAVFGLWVSFGWHAPIDLNKILWDIVPMYKYLRIPSRHLILFLFGMSALAGLGFSLIRREVFRLIIAILIIIDMVWFARNFVALKPDPAMRHNGELVSFLQQNLGMARILPNFNVGMGTRDALDFDAAMGYRFMSASGYDPAILRNYYEFAAAVAGIENPDVQQTDVQIPYLKPASRYTDFLNVKYVFVPSWFDSVAGSSPKYKLVMEENKKDYFRLYENTQVLPRFFLVPTLVGLPNRDAIARAIRMGEYDPGKVILGQTKDIPVGFTADCGTQKLPAVTVISYSMNKIILETNAPCNAILATSEVMYPGWEATIDGQSTKIIEGNLAFRTISVPKGRHTIIMSYRPTVFIVGFFVSVVTLIGCLIWMKITLKSRYI